MDRASQPVDADVPVVDPLAAEIRQSLLLLVGALGLMGMVAIALLALTSGG